MLDFDKLIDDKVKNKKAAYFALLCALTELLEQRDFWIKKSLSNLDSTEVQETIDAENVVLVEVVKGFLNG